MQADIAFTGKGVYFVAGVSDGGKEWLRQNIGFEPWQGDVDNGIAIDGGRFASEIADGALQDGLLVSVNGNAYEG